jgi:hypothetical protein
METLKKIDFNKKIVLTSYALGKGSSLIDTRRLITTSLKYQSGTLTVHLITYTIKYSDTGRIVTNIITVDDYGRIVDSFGVNEVDPFIINKIISKIVYYNLYNFSPSPCYYNTHEDAVSVGKGYGGYISTLSVDINETADY